MTKARLILAAVLPVVIAGAAWLALRRPAALSSTGPTIAGPVVAPEPESVRVEPISPIPRTVPLNPARVALGKRLFHDPRLSQNSAVSCASCHPLALAGTDRRDRSVGIHGQVGKVNAPTVFNSGFNFRQFWDGRADSLEDQVDGPMLSAIEMGSTWDEVIRRMRQDATYPVEFAAAFPNGLQPKNVRAALADFERSLVTPDSPFDRYLRGDDTALTSAELSGYAKFKSYGCISCHHGVNVGANMFQRMGIIRDYFADRGNLTEADYGRFNVTKNDADRFFFKVPSLRNVAVTAPYFHDGSARTLEEAVTVMAKYQLGRPLPPEDLADIVRFLRTLTGRYEGQPLQP